MATIAEIKELALHAAKGTAPANFSEKNVNDALRGEMAAMCSSINEFRRNQYDIFQIMIETADEVVPPKVIARMGYLSVGDLFTTNCLCYNNTDFTDENALKEALGKLGQTTVYGGADASGRICLSKTKPTYGPVLKAVKFYTMPNGEPGVKFQVIG